MEIARSPDAADTSVRATKPAELEIYRDLA
jgi:hypothetical protein